MLYSYNANKRKDSTKQILAGTVKEVKDEKVVITVPTGYNKKADYEIGLAALGYDEAPAVGQPIVAIGVDNEDGTFDVDTELQKGIAKKPVQLVEFDRCKTNIQTQAKSMEHSAFMAFPLSKGTQVKIDETKKSVTIPANIAENTTIWLRFCQNKFSHFDKFTAEGKERLGMKAYAEMLQKKLDALPEGQVLLLTHAGRFEDSVKDEATGKYTYEPAKPTANGDKISYNIFANGENALGLMLNTSMEVPKSFVFTAKASQTQAQEESAPVADETPLSEEDEMALLQQAMA